MTVPTCMTCSAFDTANFWWQNVLLRLLFWCSVHMVSPAAWLCPDLFPMVSTWVVSWGPSGISKISLNSVFTWTCPLSHSSPFPVPQVLSWLHLGHDEESHIFPFSLSVRKNYCSFLSVCISLAFLCCPSVSVCNPDVSSLPLQATSNSSKERAEALLVSGIDEPLLQMQVLQSHSKGLKQPILAPKDQYGP